VVLNLLVLPDQSPIIFDTCFVHGRFSRSACELLQVSLSNTYAHTMVVAGLYS